MRQLIMSLTALLLFTVAVGGCSQSSTTPSDTSVSPEPPQAEEMRQEAEELTEEIQDEVEDAKQEVEDFVKLGQDSPQHKFNEELEQLDERLEDMANSLDEMGENASDELRQTLGQIRLDRQAVGVQVEKLRNASAEAMVGAINAIEKSISDLNDALEEFANTMNKS